MPDNTPDDEQDPHEIVRKDLVRNVITEPLYGNIRKKPDDLARVIIDVNLQYHAARRRFRE